MAARPVDRDTHTVEFEVRHLNSKRRAGEPFRFHFTPKGNSGPIVHVEFLPHEFGQSADVRKITVEAQPGERGVLTADLARINVDRLLAAAAEAVGVKSSTAVYRIGAGGRPRTVTPAFLARVRTVRDAHPDRPRAAVAAEFGVHPRTATSYLRALRDLEEQEDAR